jgi:hypothetical protein
MISSGNKICFELYLTITKMDYYIIAQFVELKCCNAAVSLLNDFLGKKICFELYLTITEQFPRILFV